LKIFTDVASGKREDRPGLEELLHFLREGDTLIVWKLDRLGRSLQHLIEIVTELDKQGVKFRSLSEHINTESAAGRMFFQMVGMFAEYEREVIRERTNAGLAVARARGRRGGRKPVLNKSQIAQAKTLLGAGTEFMDVCRTLQCSPRTLRRRLAEDKKQVQSEQSVTVATSHPPRAAGAHRHV
jgi:DNA invertase Pin-like site-specific DNA recombinase